MAAKLGWLLLAVFAVTSSLEMGTSVMASGKLGFAAPASASGPPASGDVTAPCS